MHFQIMLFRCVVYVVGEAGIAAIHVIRALHTPLQDVTFGSGCKLRMQTYKNKLKL